jgi:hypothetical protein
MLPPGYHALNDSIPIPTQIPSGTPSVSTPSGHHLFLVFILKLPRPPSRGSLPSLIGGTNPSGTIQSFTPNYQIFVGGHFHPRGQIPIGTQPSIGGKTPATAPIGQNIPAYLAQYWNYLIQNNPHTTGEQQPQTTSFIPPSTGQPYPGPSNSIWGLNARPNVPVQGNCPNQYNPINYIPPQQQLNLPNLRIICKLLMVLLVYLRDFLSKVTSTPT